jgi:hypothetical protein
VLEILGRKVCFVAELSQYISSFYATHIVLFGMPIVCLVCSVDIIKNALDDGRVA